MSRPQIVQVTTSAAPAPAGPYSQAVVANGFRFNAAYERFLTAPYPARTTVGSFLGDFLVEIDVVAALPCQSG